MSTLNFPSLELLDLRSSYNSLTLSTAGFVIAGCVVLLVTSALLYYQWWSNSPLYGANVGPKIYPLVGSIPELLRNIGRLHEWTADYLINSPGLTFRTHSYHLGTMIITSNPANVEHILKTKFENYPKGDLLTKVLRPLLGDGIFNVDGAAWKNQRRLASHQFKAKSLRDFLVESLRSEISACLFPLLSKVAAEGTTVDLQDVFMRFGFDNICNVSFGVRTGCLDLSLPQVKFADAFDEAAELCVKVIMMPSILAGGIKRSLQEALEVIDEFAMSAIASRRKELVDLCGKSSEESVKSDLLSRLIQLSDQELQLLAEGGTRELSDIYLRDMMVSFIIAGRDTTAGTLTYFFWSLANHPEVEAKIWDELQTIIRGRQSSESHPKKGEDTPFTYDELKQMEYLQAALFETLRLYPAVPSDTKMCIADDVLPDGTRISRGDLMQYHPWTMGRTERLWGKDCLDFKPERWMKDGHFVQESPYKFPVFQAGPRVCLGKDMAVVTIKYVTATLLTSDFKLNILPGQTHQYSIGITLKMKNGLQCTVSRKSLQ